MSLYKLTATKSMGKIPKGLTLQVPSALTGNPSAKEVENARKSAGINDSQSLSWSSPGNWNVERIS